MRRLMSLAIVMVGLHLSLSSAQGQCVMQPRRAPDMMGQGFYNTAALGVVYGPNYYLRPPFAPFQGMVFPPAWPAYQLTPWCCPYPAYAHGWLGGFWNKSGYPNMPKDHCFSQGYRGPAQGGSGHCGSGHCGSGHCGQNAPQLGEAVGPAKPYGITGIPHHLFYRSPRDFFMVDTDPRTSPYNYGMVRPNSNGPND
jgi:hypothetical protein